MEQKTKGIIFDAFDKGNTSKHYKELRISAPTARKYYKEWLLLQIAKVSTERVVTGEIEQPSFYLSIADLRKIYISLKTGKYHKKLDV